MDITKCLVFDLPSGSGGMAAGIYKTSVMQHIKIFTAQYRIEFKTKTQRYKLKIWFPEEKYYTLFLLSFDWNRLWKKPYLLEELYQE